MFQALRNLFSGTKATILSPYVRSYASQTSRDNGNLDWNISSFAEDAELRTHLRELRRRSRTLFRTNPYVRKYSQALVSNVVGADGYTLQMRIQEEADRVVGGTQIQRGQPDVYANSLIERNFAEWQLPENCTVTRRLSYQQVRELRLTATARDGNVLTRKVFGFDNPFRFALQIIPADFLDLDLNRTPERGRNEIRMGVERTASGEIVAYHIFAKQDQNYLFGTDYQSGSKHLRIPASEIIHSVRLDDADATLSAPWITSTMSKLYQLDAYEEAEVRAAREASCKGGFIEKDYPSDYQGDLVDAAGNKIRLIEPGEVEELQMGQRFIPYNPLHPNQNYPEFRKAILRSIAAGLRTSYNLLANDLEGVNYSSLRTGALDERENWMLIQKWDIETNELPVFESWLESAMLVGKVPLPFAKFDKFNKPFFQGRRWKWVDPKKDAEAYGELLKLGLTTRTKILAELDGEDFEEIAQELAVEEAFLTGQNLECLTLAAMLAKPAPSEPPKHEDDEDDEPKPPKPPKKPAQKKLNGNRIHLTQ